MRAHATFCDDIRHETNGKHSLIGCYDSILYAASYPLMLPRICVRVDIYWAKEKQPESVTLKITYNENTVFEATLQDLTRVAKLAEPPSNEPTYMRNAVAANIVIENQTLETVGYFEVTLQDDTAKEAEAVGRLRVRKIDTQQTQIAPS